MINHLKCYIVNSLGFTLEGRRLSLTLNVNNNMLIFKIRLYKKRVKIHGIR